MQCSATRWRHLASPTLLLGLLSLLIVLIRGLTFSEPYERDLMVYAVAARELWAGRALYSEVWDIKPPGIYALYALAEAVFGFNRLAIFSLGVCSALVTLFGVYRVVKLLTKQEIAALWAAFFWALVCSDILLEANQPNVEVFINAFWVWALFLFVRFVFEGRKTPDLIGAGMLWGIASVFKQVALTTPLLLCLFLLFEPSKAKSSRSFTTLVALVLPVISIWLAIAAYFAATQRWDIFRFTMIDYGRLYSGENARFTSQFSWSQRLLPEAIAFVLPLAALGLIGVALSARVYSKIWVVLGVCALSVEAAIILPGNYYPHYFQLWLPLLCVAAGVGSAGWKARLKSEKVAVKTSVIIALATVFGQFSQWILSPEQVSIRKYQSDYFVRLPARARQIDAFLLPGETFYQYGFDAGYYFETRRRAPIGVLNIGSPSVPVPPRLQRVIIADLEREKPEMAILDTLFPPSDVTRYLRRNYVAVPGFRQSEPMLVMMRRGGKLWKRERKGR